jgi:hypothetical protein
MSEMSEEVKAALDAKLMFADKTIEAIEADIKDFIAKRDKLVAYLQKGQQNLNEINKAIFANQAMIAGIRRIHPAQAPKPEEVQA